CALSNKSSRRAGMPGSAVRFTAQTTAPESGGKAPPSGGRNITEGQGATFVAPCPFCQGLLAQTQFSDQSAVTVDVLLLQIGKQVAAAADHLEQAAAAVVVVLVALQVLGQVVDARGQQRDLDLRGTGVALVQGGLFD